MAIRFAYIPALLAIPCCMLYAGEPPAQALDPVLPPNPEIVKILDGLGDNCAALLPPVKVVGPLNQICKEYYMDKRGPQGRDYSNKAVWMPDRKRALFCGANHGSPHRLDDAWEFDLPSNTWALLFAPDPNNAAGVMEIAEGEVFGTKEKVKYVRTQRGGPTHYGHTWWAFCYHPEMKAGLWMNVPIGESPRKYIEKQTGTKDGIYSGPPMWAFYPAEKRWELVLSPPPYPKTGYAKAMEYIPDLGAPLFFSGDWNGVGTWSFNSKDRTWKMLKPHSGEPGSESLYCYDSARKIVVAQSSTRSTYQYDIKQNKWEKVLAPDKDSTEAPIGHDAHSVMFYDTFNKVCLLFESARPDTVWSYDVQQRKWTANKVNGPACPKGKTVAYFDEARNIFVVNRGANTWVYRYKRAAK